MWRAHRIDDAPVPLDRIPNMSPDCGAEAVEAVLDCDEGKASNDRNESGQRHIARGQPSHVDELTAAPEPRQAKVPQPPPLIIPAAGSARN